MIVWGGYILYKPDEALGDGGRYNPLTDSWTPTSMVGAPEPRGGPLAVWTGSEMLVWGGSSRVGNFVTGGRYNPSLASWMSTSIAGAPTNEYERKAVWSGTEMLVWGGTITGIRYDPF